MNENIIPEEKISAENEELKEELDKREKSLKQKKADTDKLGKKVLRHRNINLLTAAMLMIAIVLALFMKYYKYFKPENVNYDTHTVSASEDTDVKSLQVMYFNEDLTVAFEPILIVDNRDKSANINFISSPSCRVLVRAEIFTKRNNLGNKPLKLFFTDCLYPDTESPLRIGSTGWIRPGEMITKMELDELPTKMCDVTVRFTAVNPANQKINCGVFTMNTVLHIVDYNGKMLDENGNWIEAETE